MKKCVVFNLTFFGTPKKDYKMSAREMFSFLPLINGSVTTSLILLLQIISPITLSNIINT